jgi:signal transduction histidine kinase/CheY-like chemotaxis protein
LHRLGDTVVVANSDGVAFGPAQRPVAHTAGLRAPFLATTDDGTLWLLGEQNGHTRLGRLRSSDGMIAWETVAAKGLAQLADAHHLSASGTTLTITGSDRILELNTAELKPSYRLAPPHLRFTVVDQQTGRTATHASLPTTLTADTNSLTFSGTLSFDEFGERPAFERRLLPTETVWIATRHGENITYPSLAPGDYVLEVRSTHLGRTGATISHAFAVPPPWYLSPGAFLGYISILGLAGYGFYRHRTRQIRARNEELERIVAERTRQLAEASAAKTEFVASMSHEIRNPMNGVLGLVTMLGEQPAHPRQANTLRLLQSCAEQLRATVDDILDFSKIEARSITLDPIAFDLRETLEASATTVDLTGQAIVFTEQLPPGIRLHGDAPKLRQIFANYLNNALKYGLPPRARVGTILTPIDEHHVRLTLSVTSTGPTIEKEALDKLFESFTRGNDTVGRNIRGTGLGLAICKRYAEAMGGEVGAVSTNGETTFYLNLPFEKLSAPALTSADAAVADPHPSLPAHALAIEDEDYNRIVLGNILAKMNYTVDWATNGAEALALAQRRGYDIILTDYRLPDTDGVTLAKKILALVPEPKPAVFAVTAYSTKEKREECLRAGMAGFISKPITLEKLRGALQSWGESRLSKISLEATPRPLRPVPRDAEIETKWAEIKRIAATDPLAAAQLTHALLGYCRNQHRIDLAEQLELLEEAWRQGRDPRDYLSAIEGFLHA